MASQIQGSCLCKAVQFEADAIDGPGSACHCVMCQKSHGGPFGAYIRLVGLRYTKGEHAITAYPSSEYCTRSFCKFCGSTLQFLDRRHPDDVSFAISSLDGEHGATVALHIYADTCVKWHPITDDLPRFSEDHDSTEN